MERYLTHGTSCSYSVLDKIIRSRGGGVIPSRTRPHHTAARNFVRTSTDFISLVSARSIPWETLHIRLIDLIDADLLPNECEIASYNDGDAPHATVVELRKDSLTEAGRREWADVLNRKINGITHGAWGYFVHLETIEMSELDRIRDFVLSYAGYCDETDYERWFGEV